MNELATTEQSPLDKLAKMDLSSIDPDKLEKLLEVQERWEGNEAKKAYAKAMAECQAEVPNVIHAANRNNQTNSNYAKYDAVVRAIKPIYVRHGFTVSFGESPCDREGFILVVATVRHSSGHAETFQRFAPIDNLGPKGNPTKTMLHGCESSMKYMQRKLLESIFGASEGDEVADDDGQAAGAPEPVDQQTGDEIAALLEQVEEIDPGSKKRLLDWVGVNTPYDIPSRKAGDCIAALNRKLKGGAQ